MHPAAPPPVPAVTPGHLQGVQVNSRPAVQLAVFEESIATGAFRRVGIADLVATTKAWREGRAAGGGSSASASTQQEVERLDPSSYVSPSLLTTLRSAHRFAQALLVGLLLCINVFISQYSDNTALLIAWTPHANWARIATFVLSVLSWLGAAEQYAAYRRAVVAARVSPQQQLTQSASPPVLAAAYTLASGRAAMISWAAYTLLLATVFATMPSDQRMSAQASALKTGIAPTAQLISETIAWKGLLPVRLVCALIGWISATWVLMGPQEVDALVMHRHWQSAHAGSTGGSREAAAPAEAAAGDQQNADSQHRH